MQIVAHTGIVKEVIDAVNLAYADGPLSTTRTILLTREEMDEFVKANPFEGGVGKYYGDGDIPSLMNVQNMNDGVTVTSFYLNGVFVACTPIGKDAD